MTGAVPIDRLFRTAALLAVAAVFAACSGGIVTQRAHLLQDLPPWAELHRQNDAAVIRTAAGEERISMVQQDGVLHISSEELLYTSKPEWAVADSFVYDFDRDGSDEVMLHVWKRGSFGEHQPFWRKPDDKFRMTEHLFIFDWDGRRENPLVPLWMSSQIPVQAQTVDVDDAGIIRIEAPDGSVTLWEWGSWGLVRREEPA